MKQTNVYYLYSLGRELKSLDEIDISPKGIGMSGALAARITQSTPVGNRFHASKALIDAASALLRLRTGPIKLEISASLAMDLVALILPLVEELQSKTKAQQGLTEDEINKIKKIQSESNKLSYILEEELARVDLFFVEQKGIYKTTDLVNQAENQVSKVLRNVLPPKAREDLNQSGRCLAFETGTASSFHMWRALESTIDAYYHKLTGRSLHDGKIERNWHSYIQALEASGAEKKITIFLDHIRKEYRNPVSHPESQVELDDAIRLFGAGASAISQLLSEISRV